MGRNHNTDLKDVWQTPEWVTDMLGLITLDPCAGPDTDHATFNWAIERGENGLERDWFGRVFVNPPFSEKEDWLEQAVLQHTHDDVECVFVLTPDSTDTKSWWHAYIANHADFVWFSEGRISYIDPDTGEPAGSPTFGTAISIFGHPGESTLRMMDDNGWLTRTVNFGPEK